MGQAVSQDPPDFAGDDTTPLPKDSFTLPLPLGSSCDWQPLHSGCFLSQNIGLSLGDRWKSVTQREAGSLKATLPSKLRNLSRPHVPGVLCSNGWLCQVSETQGQRQSEGLLGSWRLRRPPWRALAQDGHESFWGSSWAACFSSHCSHHLPSLGEESESLTKPRQSGLSALWLVFLTEHGICPQEPSPSCGWHSTSWSQAVCPSPGH